MENRVIATNNEIVFYKRNSGENNIELLINGETLWLTQKTMAEIFCVQRLPLQNIRKAYLTMVN